MAYPKITSTQKYMSSELTTNHDLASQIDPKNEIDDIIILNIGVDGNKIITAPTGFNELRENGSGGVRHGVYWRRATAANEALPEVVISGNDSVSVNYIVMFGAPTGSTPIGNTALNTGTSSSPTFPSISYSANSTVLFLGVNDGTKDVESIDSGIIFTDKNNGLAENAWAGKKFFTTSGSTGTVTAELPASDGWQTFVLEILDNGTGEQPLYIDNVPAESFPHSSNDTDNGWREVFTNSQVEPDTGNPVQTALTFDANTGVDITTDQINIPSHGLTTGFIYRLDENGNALPSGVTNGQYVYVHVVDVDNIQLVDCTLITTNTVNVAGGYYDDNTLINSGPNIIDLTAVGSGICRLEFSGFHNQGSTSGSQAFARQSATCKSHGNGFGFATRFTGGRDMSEERLSTEFVLPGSINSEAFITFVDTDGDYKTWQIESGGVPYSSGRNVQIQPNNNKHKFEYQTFNSSAVEYIVLWFRGASNDGRLSGTTTWYFDRTQILRKAIVLGGEGSVKPTLTDLYSELQFYTEETSTRSVVGDAFSFSQLIQFGNGSTTCIMDATARAIEFPQASDGITSLNNYTVNSGFLFNQSANDDVQFNACLFSSDGSYDLNNDAGSSPSATLSFTSCSIKGASIVLRAGNVFTGNTVSKADKAVFDGTNINGSSFTETTSSSAAVEILANSTIEDLTVDVGNADYNLILGQLVTAITLDGVTFSGTPNVNKIQGLDTSGTNTITTDNGTNLTIASPSSEVTSSGATYNVLGPSPTLTISCPAGGVLEVFDNDDSPADWQDKGALLQTKNPTTGSDVDFVHSKAGDDIIISFIKPGYEEITVPFNLTSSNQSIDLNNFLITEVNI